MRDILRRVAIFRRMFAQIRYSAARWNIIRLEQEDSDIAGLVVLVRNAVFVQKIATKGTSIQQISIQFATFQRENDCLIDVSLLKENGEVVYHEAIRAASLYDNAYRSLSLPSEFSTGQDLWLAVGSPDANGQNYVAVWMKRDGGVNLRRIKRAENPLSGIGREYRGLALAVRVVEPTDLDHDRRRFLRRPYDHVRCKGAVVQRVALAAAEMAEAASILELCEQDRVTVQRLASDTDDLDDDVEMLLLPATHPIAEARVAAKRARLKGIPVVAYAFGDMKLENTVRDALPSYVDGLISDRTCALGRLSVHVTSGAQVRIFDKAADAYAARRLPKVSIITILSGKAEQLAWSIRSYFSQSYSGEIEVIYVDDDSQDNSSRIVEREFLRCDDLSHPTRRLSYRIIQNGKNLGNCISRNRGVEAASGDILVVIDADCVLNADFIAAHVDAHSYLDCEAVIGPLNIETLGAAPDTKLAQLEKDPSLILAEAELQDRMNLESFLNCITRNFSIKRTAIVEELFDPEFSYSRSPTSGFGWEDVEMGYRLYKRGCRIKFTQEAFSVHISHPSSIPESEKPKRSLKNFRKLFDKHPELAYVARRWSIQRLRELARWLKRVDKKYEHNADLSNLQARFAEFSNIALQVSRMRPLKILTYRWHVPHQYELYKTGHQFFLVTGLGTPMCENWEFNQRPLPGNVRFISAAEIAGMGFDAAILHFDENVLSWENTNGKVGQDWGATFRWFVEHIDLPKVAICHGTPQFYGQYTPGYDKPDLMKVIESARQRLVKYVEEIEIVCNSHQAQREWGFHRSRVIWHGFDPTEFPPSTYERGILSPLGPLVSSRPHYRGYYLYQQVFKSDFPAEFLPSKLTVPNPDIDYTGNVFAVSKYKNYIDQLRKYSVYFNPTLRSPMPRARAEPMMCGVVTVSANNHDVDMFIKNGVNGFYSSDANELREQLLFLMRSPEAVRKIGAEARRTALDVFNHDRYLSEWTALLRSIV